MSDLLLVLLLAGAAASGIVAAIHWWRRPGAGSEWRTYLHGSAAGLVLLVLLLGLDHEAPDAIWRLGGIFLAIATGMLLFLTRQRQKRFPRPLLGLHVAFALAALLLTGVGLG